LRERGEHGLLQLSIPAAVEYPARHESAGHEPYVDVGGSFNDYPGLRSRVIPLEGSVTVGVEGSEAELVRYRTDAHDCLREQKDGYSADTSHRS